LIWMLLTKRPENMARLFARETLEKCGVGTTTEDQPNADIRVPHLLRTPAGWRFISAEPLLGPMNIERWLRAEVCDHPDEFCEDIGCRGETWLDLVIAGGETDSDRPSHPDWFRSLRDQCVLAGVAFFFKQHGDWLADDLLDNLRHIGKFLTVDGRTLPKDDETFRAIEQGRFDFTGYQHFSKVGKKAAGRLLDGREWNEFPNV
jgi:protein gp37